MLLNMQLRQLGLRPVDVGSEGDFFFRAVSHHLLIRQAGVQYLSDNPEHLTESNTENSWNEHLNSMSMQGTWCDALFVQTVADCQNVAIHIIESQPQYLAQHLPATILRQHTFEEIHNKLKKMKKARSRTSDPQCNPKATETKHKCPSFAKRALPCYCPM